MDFNKPKGNWSLNLKTGVLFWDEVTKQIHEVPNDFNPELDKAINFYREDYRAMVEENVHKLVTFNQNFEMVCCLVTAKGHEVWTKSSGFAVDFEDDKVVKIAGTFYNCTDEINDVNLQAAQSHALEMSSVITHSDVEGKITHVNDMFCKVSGYSREEIIGQDHDILNSGVHPKDYFKGLWSTILEGQVWHGEICNRAKDGSLFWLDTHIYPLKNLNGEIYQFLSVRFDVTDRKMREEQEKQFYGLVTIGENSASILHEVMNPLSIVSAKLEFLKKASEKESFPATVTKHIAGMEKGVQRISQIFQDMRTMLHGSMEFKTCIMKDVIEKVRAFSLMKLHKNSVALIIKGDLESNFFGNEGYLLQVLINLINNSIDAIKDEKEKWIEISVVNSIDNEVLVSVTDSGLGIPKEHQKKIFDPLYSTKKNKGGTGLGLSLSKRLIESMEGEICYNTNSEHTRFEISLKKYSDSIRYKSAA